MKNNNTTTDDMKWGIDVRTPAENGYRPVLHLKGTNGWAACSYTSIQQDVPEDKKYLYRRCRVCKNIAKRMKRKEKQH